jgi:protein-tyrosine phosphatase
VERPNPSEVKDRVRAILSRMADLEKELKDEFHRRGDQVRYQISNRKVRFNEEVRAAASPVCWNPGGDSSTWANGWPTSHARGRAPFHPGGSGLLYCAPLYGGLCRLPGMERRIDLPGCDNFRDLGGYPARAGMRLRWRRLFRSDALHGLTLEGVDRVVDELGIGAIVDLRSTGEVRIDGRGPLRERSPVYHHLPLFDGPLIVDPESVSPLTLADRYFLMVEHAKVPIARVVTALAECSTPAVYHCAAGKDRTGLISAIVLGLLGVPDEFIVADYAATQDNLDAIIDRLMQSSGYREAIDNLPADTLHAKPGTMFSLLDRLRDRYGSFRGYANDIGVSDAVIHQLKGGLLEPDPA